MMIKAALIGLGKMGISHQAIIAAHPDAKLVAVCDAASYVLALMEKYTGVKTYSDYQKMIDSEELDCVFIATPSRFHGEMVRYALDRNLHVFCEKPFCLDVEEGVALARLAERKRLVTQVGYHCRFVGAFREARRLASANVLGSIHHVQVEAYGPVVVKTKGSTWRHSKAEGGGCLYDYACHAIDLMHYVVGVPHSVGGTVVKSIFSQDVDDEVYSTFYYENGITGHLAANWSDDSYRKMFTRITLWGSKGRLSADRQECQIYLRESNTELSLDAGWTIKNTVELTEPVWFYLRGEEYSAQVNHFIESVKAGNHQTESTFGSALATDRIVQMLRADADGRRVELPKNNWSAPAKKRSVLQNLLFGKR